MDATPAPRGVLFDLGGVVLGSPLAAIDAYERELGAAPGGINRLVASGSADAAWQRLERGELTLEQFYPLFERQCQAHGLSVDAVELMRRVHRATAPRPRVLSAIARLRARGIVVAALTNNWPGDSTLALAASFDVFLESCALGMRKPDPRIYPLSAERMGLLPREILYLDDIGYNLKPAAALGMRTLKITREADVLDALAPLLA